MEDKQESIMKDMEETRSSMTEKLEALETHVADKVKPMADAVEHITSAAANMVEDVKETVHEVTHKVEATASAVASAFDLRKQTDRHPWVMFGIAATAGCVLGSFLGSRSRRRSKGSSNESPKHAKESNGKSHLTRMAAPKRERASQETPKESWFGESLGHLKDLAVGSLMSAVRDLAIQAIPGAIGGKIAEEIESMTKKMGAEPIQGPLFNSQPENKQDHPNESDGSGRGSDSVNRILATG